MLPPASEEVAVCSNFSRILGGGSFLKVVGLRVAAL
jgi:hypothetical protein